MIRWTGLEHNAVMRPLEQMKAVGVDYDIARTDRDGNLDLEHLRSLIGDSTRAVLVTHASNVCGTVVPIEEIGKICQEYDLILQWIRHRLQERWILIWRIVGLIFWRFTGHKGLLGPQGIGGFLISERLDRDMKPLIAGGTGSQSDSLLMPENLPDKYESGTMNLPGIIGLHTALSYLEEQGIGRIHDRKMSLTGYFLERVSENSKIRIVGRKDLEHRVAVVSLDFQTMDNAVAAFELEQAAGL